MTTDQPRDDAGQFSSAEPLTGIHSVEEAQGYTRMPEPEAPPEQESSIREEAQKLAASRVPEDPIMEIGYQTPEGERVDTSETVTLDRAASDLSVYHGQQDAALAKSVSTDFAAEIDRMRGEQLDALKSPEAEKELGLSKEEIQAAKLAVETPSTDVEPVQLRTPDDATTNAPPADAFDNIPGLEPELKEVLRKSPQARQFLEQQATETDQVKQAYSSGLNNAQAFAQSALITAIPVFGQYPVEQWIPLAQSLAQAGDPRGQQAATLLQNVAAINERQQLVEHYQQTQRHQQFESYVKNEDVRTEQLAKAEGIEVDYNKIVGYWEKQGLNRNQIYQLYKGDPVAASAEARLLVLKAARYDEIVKAPRPRGTKELPPVGRPGNSQVHRSGGDNSSAIAALKKQISELSGDKAAKAAARLMQLQRKG